MKPTQRDVYMSLGCYDWEQNYYYPTLGKGHKLTDRLSFAAS